MCIEELQAKVIQPNEVEIATQECFICTKPVCDFHSSVDAKNEKIIICDNCQIN